MTRRGNMQSANYFLGEALAERWNVYARRLAECGRKCNGDSLRRLRVAIRRLLSHVEAAQRIYRSREGQTARRLLKRQLKALGPLRDLQMQVCRLENWERKYPPAADVLRWLKKREHKRNQRARRTLRKVEPGELKKEVQKAIGKSERFLLKSGLSAQARTQKALEASFRKSIDPLRGIGSANNQHDPQSPHCLQTFPLPRGDSERRHREGAKADETISGQDGGNSGFGSARAHSAHLRMPQREIQEPCSWAAPARD